MKISIAIPIYNAEDYLPQAIHSVINQSFSDWELLLVDDGSQDNSLAIAKDYAKKDSRIRVIHDGQNKKLPTRLNQIIDESKGEYIARMDADDLIHPDRLKLQLSFLEENPQYDLVSTGTASINNDNKVYGYRVFNDANLEFIEPRPSYPITHASILAKRSWYERNRYNTDHPRSQDYELWCRTSSNKDLKIAILPDLLYYYREEGNLDAKKLTSSYLNHFIIYSKYSKSFSLKNLLKVGTKIAIVKGLSYTGFLQMIAKRRNKGNLKLETINEHQKIINEIIASMH